MSIIPVILLENYQLRSQNPLKRIMKIVRGTQLLTVAGFLLYSVESRPSDPEDNYNGHSPPGHGLWYQEQPDGGIRFGANFRVVRDPEERTPGRAPDVSHMNIDLLAYPPRRRAGQSSGLRNPAQPRNPNVRPQPPYVKLFYGGSKIKLPRSSSPPPEPQGQPAEPQGPPAAPQSPPARSPSPPARSHGPPRIP